MVKYLKMEGHSLSIIIPVFNQAIHLKKTLSVLKDQIGNNERVEIVVVDNDSSDDSKDIAENFGVKVYLFGGEKNPYLARNFGVSKSSGDILAFLDAKCTPGVDYLDQILASIKEYEVWDLIAGDFVLEGLSSNSTLSELAYAVMNLRVAPKYNGGEISALTGNMIVKKEVFEELGRFDNRRSGGDIRFTRKVLAAHKKVKYNPNLIVAYKAKKKEDLIASIKRDARDLEGKLSWKGVRPAGWNYMKHRLVDLKISLGFLKMLRLSFYIMYLRLIRYNHQSG